MQWTLGLVLLMTGLGKLLDVPGFIAVLRTYRAIPEILLPIVAVSFVIIELRLSEAILRGKKLEFFARISIFLHVMFAGWSALTLLRGVDVPNCGCFGVFWSRPLNWGTVAEDLFFAVWSWVLARLAAKHKSHRRL